MIQISYKKLIADVSSLAETIKKSSKSLAAYDGVYGIPRGGVPIALLLAKELNLPVLEKPTEHTLIIDDLIDSGRTLEGFTQDKAVLYAKPHSPRNSVNYLVDVIDGWIEFPYEDTEKDITENVVRILEHLGEDPTREGLRETPKRYIKFLKQFIAKEEFNFTTFENEGTDEMIVQQDISFFSLCEHHLAPFFGTATVAYIPSEKIVGLSKLARTVRYYAQNFQNQERITSQVADKLQVELDPIGVAVTLKARHFCMEMRGVKTHDTHTVTTKLTGAFKDKPETRAEYMNFVK